MDKGLFISFEGGEGAGKTTLIQTIAKFLLGKNCQVLITREPGGTTLGERVRKILLDSKESIDSHAELCLFLASRSQHLQEVILPALEKKKVVLCDRFNDSSIAYQGYGRDLGIEKVQNLCSSVCNDIDPDLTFYLDLSPKEGFKRIRQGRDRIELEKQSFHQKVRQGYLLLAEKEPDRIKVLNATFPKHEVFQNARKYIEKFFL